MQLDDYKPALFKGKIMIYELKSEELVACVNFDAMSSTSISAKEF
ncbi:MAG: hypothetical protein ACI865_003267 [Flavobacteriaceae bacterium]|jgi:hypothetical protein